MKILYSPNLSHRYRECNMQLFSVSTQLTPIPKSKATFLQHHLSNTGAPTVLSETGAENVL